MSTFVQFIKLGPESKKMRGKKAQEKARRDAEVKAIEIRNKFVRADYNGKGGSVISYQY